ncbi:MAG: hypothetical protein IPP57_04080 [Candidatus Obscuribacter sp.]|nr:hypothetical protein [Candidatus Obscuribacter sp.]
MTNTQTETQNQLNTEPERVRATLRIYHPELNPDEITALLGLSPSVAWTRG